MSFQEQSTRRDSRIGMFTYGVGSDKLESQPTQRKDLSNCYLLLPSLMFGTNRIRLFCVMVFDLSGHGAGCSDFQRGSIIRSP